MAGKLLALFWACFKIGLLAFGGGNTAIPLLEAEAVPHWVSRQEFAELVGVNFAFPGVSILKLAGMIGFRTAGTAGLLVAITGLAMPGLLLTMGAYSILQRFRDHVLVSRALLAMQYAAVALLVSSGLKMLQSAGSSRVHLPGLFMAGTLFTAVHFLRLPPAAVVLLALVVGVAIL